MADEATPTTPSGEGSTTPSAETTPAPAETSITLTQEKLDKIIASRVAETKAKFGDYDELKSAAERLAQIEAENLSELERANKRAEDAETRAAEAESTASKTLLEAQKSLVAAQAGLPPELAELLKGETKDELEAHAETLKRFAVTPPATPTEDEGVSGGPERREQPNGMTRDQIAQLAKSDPRKFNAMVDKGEIDLSKV